MTQETRLELQRGDLSSASIENLSAPPFPRPSSIEGSSDDSDGGERPNRRAALLE